MAGDVNVCYLCSKLGRGCGESKGRIIGAKGVKTLIQSANGRNDSKLKSNLVEAMDIWIADKCYKEYNDPRKIAKALDDTPPVKQQPNEGFERRQRIAPFDF